MNARTKYDAMSQHETNAMNHLRDVAVDLADMAVRIDTGDALPESLHQYIRKYKAADAAWRKAYAAWEEARDALHAEEEPVLV